MNAQKTLNAIFDVYSSPFKLMNAFFDRCQDDIATINAAKKDDQPLSIRDMLSASPEGLQSYAQNARCLSYIMMASFAFPLYMATSVANPVAGLIAFTGVALASKKALKVEEQYQSSRTQAKPALA